MRQFAERHFSTLVVAIWILAGFAVLVISRDAIADWKMGDPDDQLRLLQVRDWLAGQSWWDITQYRMNSPDGGPMHWSRLVDIPLAGMILLLTPMLGMALAEQVTAATVPILTLGVALGFYAALVRRMFGSVEALIASGLFITILPIMSQLLPMRIDHHGWQLVCFFAAVWGLVDRKARWQSSMVLGIACALWMEISIEGLPFAALLLGLSALRWIFPALSPAPMNERHQFPLALSSAAVGSGLLFTITDSWAAANHCDALSPFHIIAFTSMAVVIMAGSILGRKFKKLDTVHSRMLFSGIAAATGIALVMYLAPHCAGDAFGTLDPMVREYWYQRVPEGLPLWAVQIDFAIQQFAYLLAGAIALVYIIRFDRRLSNPEKISLCILYVGAALIGTFVGRAAVYAMSIANILLAIFLVDLFALAERTRGLVGRMSLRTMAIILAMPNLPAQAVLNQINIREAIADPQREAFNRKFLELAKACQKTSAAAALKQLPTSQLMVGLDSSAAILQFTDHKVVATGHHRNQEAMADVIRFFTGSPVQAGEIAAARDSDYLVICEGSYELAIYERDAPDGFLAQLRRGTVPAWLVRQGNIGAFQVFRVNRAALTHPPT